ncbi:hypothetical protein [Streptomyces mirabilis]|uniref:hypothetical protein n=1 Tax=Streptomyces mirabilis TaxID=68239 RepID=UPI0036617CB4
MRAGSLLEELLDRRAELGGAGGVEAVSRVDREKPTVGKRPAISAIVSCGRWLPAPPAITKVGAAIVFGASHQAGSEALSGRTRVQS